MGLVNLAQVLSAAVSVVALVGIWVQLRYQGRQVDFDSLNNLHQELLSAPMQKALRFIFSADADSIMNPKDEIELEKIEFVLNTFDLVGFRVRKGVLPKEPTLETEWMILLPLWSKVQGFVAKQSKLRGGVPYKQHLKYLVGEAETYRKCHKHPEPVVAKCHFAQLPPQVEILSPVGTYERDIPRRDGNRRIGLEESGAIDERRPTPGPQADA